MKRLFRIAAILIAFSGCVQEQDCRDSDPPVVDKMDPGIITGLDPRDCMCCGGWFIRIKDTTYRFDQVPADCKIDFSTVTYPLNVRLEWKKKDTTCLGDEIWVLKLVLR